MSYEYQVLESDSPAVPSEMLNEQGGEGWMLCGTTVRSVRDNEKGENRWIFYFVRIKKED
jgi:hypothetical protein